MTQLLEVDEVGNNRYKCIYNKIIFYVYAPNYRIAYERAKEKINEI